jgi:hypothetical protein
MGVEYKYFGLETEWYFLFCTRRDYSRLCRSPRWGRRRFALAMSRAWRSARTRGSNQYARLRK